MLWSTKNLLCIIMYKHLLCKSTINKWLYMAVFNSYSWITRGLQPYFMHGIYCINRREFTTWQSTCHDLKRCPAIPKMNWGWQIWHIIYLCIYMCMYILDNCVTVYLVRGMTYYSWSFNWWLDHCKPYSDKWLIFTYIPCHIIAFPQFICKSLYIMFGISFTPTWNHKHHQP